MMDSGLIVLLISYLSLLIIGFKTGISFKNTGKVPRDHFVAFSFILFFCVFFSFRYIHTSNIHKNLDSIFSYDFDGCSAAIHITSEKISSPYEVEACGKHYEVYVKSGVIEKVKKLK